MQLTVEISMYPQTKDYIPPIDAFIKQLNSYPGLQVDTYPTATVLVGEYNAVMDALKDALAWSYTAFGMTVFATKFITGYEAK
jgi:uncharacterized protein YqgV (UPF0045/DUF77 family)